MWINASADKKTLLSYGGGGGGGEARVRVVGNTCVRREPAAAAVRYRWALVTSQCTRVYAWGRGRHAETKSTRSLVSAQWQSVGAEVTDGGEGAVEGSVWKRELLRYVPPPALLDRMPIVRRARACVVFALGTVAVYAMTTARLRTRSAFEEQSRELVTPKVFGNRLSPPCRTDHTNRYDANNTRT